MKPFTADHPRLRSPPGVMSGDEIRYWFRELWTNPDHGWKGHPAALMNALGIHNAMPKFYFEAKLIPGVWIYPGEQIKFSRKLAKIIDGTVVCRPGPKPKRGGRTPYLAVLADHPVPLKGRVRYRYDMASGRLGFILPKPSVSPTLPTFGSLIANAPKGHSWRP